jgi:AI-2 transport protein TqsA
MSPLLIVFLSLGIALIAGTLAVLGKSVIVPLLIALIAVYVLNACVDWLQKRPVLRHVPRWGLHLAVLGAFVACLTLLGSVVAVTLEEMADRVPAYQEKMEALIAKGAKVFDFYENTDWQDFREATMGRINLSAILGYLFSSLTNIGTTLFLVILYVGFLLGEIGQVPEKVRLAFHATGRSDRFLGLITEINRKVAEYLSVKTAINVVLGLLSLGVLWLFGVDFALFWALMIGLFNYIPYLGSWLGVAFPVLLSVAQFGDLGRTAALAAALTVMQVFVGNVLEPRWIGRQLNLSPVAVLVALSVWSSLWGLAGAILAVPLTSMMVIVFNAIPETRPIAILLSDLPGSRRRA